MLDDRHIVRFFDCMSQRKQSQLENLLSDSAEFYFPKTQPLLGKDRILKFFKFLWRQYPELTFEIQRVVLQGQTAAVHWTNRGMSRKGDPYENEGVTLLEIKDDKIVYISDFFKDTGLF
jgi:ketosteroid isomerase-like protein